MTPLGFSPYIASGRRFPLTARRLIGATYDVFILPRDYSFCNSTVVLGFAMLFPVPLFSIGVLARVPAAERTLATVELPGATVPTIIVCRFENTAHRVTPHSLSPRPSPPRSMDIRLHASSGGRTRRSGYKKVWSYDQL